MKETIKEKLTSRKLWVAVCGFVALIIVAMGGAEETAAQVAAIIMAGATVVAYIIGEGLVDAEDAKTTTSSIETIYELEKDLDKATEEGE